jgi:pimeloyl-ACP methyl ester carboxylesterase
MRGFLITLLMAAFHYANCQRQAIGPETVLDGVIHIEDSIRHEVPKRPRLCDSADSVKEEVDIGGCSLFVEQQGEGIAMVLINGGPGGTHHYFHPWFSEISNTHRLIYYDQRGTGLSDFNPQEGYSFMQAVEDLEKLRRKLNISQWVVCGFSYGGGLAQMYTASYPEHVLGMVLISSLPLFESEQIASEQDKYLSDPEKRRKNALIREYLDGNLSMEAFLYNLKLNGDWKRQYYFKPTEEEMIRAALYE